MKKLISILLTLLLMGCQVQTTINLDEYVTVENYGLNGHGSLVMNVDPLLLDELSEKTDLSVYEINQLYDSITLKNQRQNYQNGDVASIKLDYIKDLGVKFETTVDKFTVSELPSEKILSNEDLLKMLEIEIEGISSGAMVSSIYNASRDPYLLGLTFSPKNNFRLTNGKVIEFDIEKSREFIESGYQLESPTLAYEVSGLEELVLTNDMLTDEVLHEIDQIGRATIDQYLKASGPMINVSDYVLHHSLSSSFQMVEVDTSQIDPDTLELATITIIKYFDPQGMNNGLPYNSSSLYVTYRTTIDSSIGQLENVQIGVSRYGQFVQKDGKLTLLIEQDGYTNFTVDVIENRKGTLSRLRFEDYKIDRNISIVDYLHVLNNE